MSSRGWIAALDAVQSSCVTIATYPPWVRYGFNDPWAEAFLEAQACRCEAKEGTGGAGLMVSRPCLNLSDGASCSGRMRTAVHTSSLRQLRKIWESRTADSTQSRCPARWDGNCVHDLVCWRI